MHLTLVRKWFHPHCTIGTLAVNDKADQAWYTLEDVVREKKIPDETAIPAGRYEVVVTMSARFKKRMPLLLNVPGFEGVRIHSGNTSADTEGCLLVGLERGEETIYKSREAFRGLFALIDAAALKEKVWLTIIERRQDNTWATKGGEGR
jgi:hypothetical protein